MNRALVLSFLVALVTACVPERFAFQRTGDGAVDARVDAARIDSSIDGRVDVIEEPLCVGDVCGCLPPRTPCAAGCVDLASDDANCGACGTACTAGHHCVSRACACPGGWADCSGTCVNTSSDPVNCGLCGRACGNNRVCTGGNCACATGLTDCGGTCTDLLTDGLSCGSCGHLCPGGSTCQGGTCVCGGGRTLCGSTCVDTNSDPLNCGTCGTVCPSTHCLSSYCTVSNDTCAGGAVPLAQHNAFPGNTCLATADGGGCSSGPDLYYVFTPSASGTYSMSVSPSASFTIVVFGSTCTTVGSGCVNPLTQYITAGSTVYFMVKGTGTCGPFMVQWD